jgi:hypothetical protein
MTDLPNLHIKKMSGKERRITDTFIQNGESIFCQQHLNKLTLQKTKFLPTLEETSKMLTLLSDVRNGNVTGLGCRTNKTISFFYIDSLYHSVFLKHLNIPNTPKIPSVILVDLNDENVFLLRDKLNYRNLGK